MRVARHSGQDRKTQAGLADAEAVDQSLGPLPSLEFKVLVADDSPIYRKLVEYALSDHHYTALFAKNGRQAMDLFAEHQPALVVTDWVMPDITGIELCRHIREQSQTVYTYIIMLTSMSDKEKIVSGLAAGADDYLTKPFDAEELLARVGVGRRVVDLHRQIEAKNRQLEELALTDSLTSLPNRRALEAWAARQLDGAARHGFSFWVVMADLDSFKNVNDTYGHAAGDTVLKKFAEILKINTRKSNFCARIGGEEFLLVLTHAEQENVEIAVGRIREQFEAHKFEFGERTLNVTASFGVSGWQGVRAPDLDLLVSQADEALYSAKRNGRNRIEFASL
jgi:two-component system, cell cycle response regulator